MNKDWKQLRKRAEEQGWRVVATMANHLKWIPPNGGQILFSGKTPSDCRALKNHIANMRRLGGFNG